MVPVMSIELHNVFSLVLILHGPALADGHQRDTTTNSFLLQHGGRPRGVERSGWSGGRTGAPRGKAGRYLRGTGGRGRKRGDRRREEGREGEREERERMCILHVYRHMICLYLSYLILF